MSKSSGLGEQFFISGYDLSGDVGSLSNVHGGPSLLDVTAINKYAHERLGGQVDAGLGFNAWFNDATAQAHPVLSALPTGLVHIMYVHASTIGAAAACMISRQINYDPTRGQDGSLSFAVEAHNMGTGMEWAQMLTLGKRTDTAATNGASHDGGAIQATAVAISTSSVANPTVITTTTPHLLTTGDSVVIAGHSGSTPTVNGSYTVTVTGASTFTIPVNVSVGGTGGTVTRTNTAYGLSAYLHVFSFTGTDVTVKLQDSADNSTFANLTGGAFTAVTAAPTVERIATTTTRQVRRYLRAVTTTSGGVTSVTFAVAYMRALTSTVL